MGYAMVTAAPIVVPAPAELAPGRAGHDIAAVLDIMSRGLYLKGHGWYLQLVGWVAPPVRVRFMCQHDRTRTGGASSGQCPDGPQMHFLVSRAPERLLQLVPGGQGRAEFVAGGLVGIIGQLKPVLLGQPSLASPNSPQRFLGAGGLLRCRYHRR